MSCRAEATVTFRKFLTATELHFRFTVPGYTVKYKMQFWSIRYSISGDKLWKLKRSSDLSIMKCNSAISFCRQMASILPNAWKYLFCTENHCKLKPEWNDHYTLSQNWIFFLQCEEWAVAVLNRLRVRDINDTNPLPSGPWQCISLLNHISSIWCLSHNFRRIPFVSELLLQRDAWELKTGFLKIPLLTPRFVLSLLEIYFVSWKNVTGY